jgi:hypothetical protein
VGDEEIGIGASEDDDPRRRVPLERVDQSQQGAHQRRARRFIGGASIVTRAMPASRVMRRISFEFGLALLIGLFLRVLDRVAGQSRRATGRHKAEATRAAGLPERPAGPRRLKHVLFSA